MKNLILLIFAASLLTSIAAAASIELSWQDYSDNEDGFIVERRLDSAGAVWMPVATVVSSEPETIGAVKWTDIGVGRGVAYVYRVKAFNEFGESGYSNEAKGKAEGGPKAPSNASAREVADPPSSTTGGVSNL